MRLLAIIIKFIVIIFRKLYLRLDFAKVIKTNGFSSISLKIKDLATVVLGLSGGVDSLVSAILLKKKGHRVIACSFKLWTNEESVENARLLAEKLEIEFRVIDITKAFKKQIVDPFINDYIGGETPSPCVWCNNEIKVYYLYQEMINCGADFFATGHYIQIKEEANQHYIYKGVDQAKDQSYFLWNVRSKYLKYWLTPLGEFLKTEVKQIAIDHKMGFLAHKKESMGVCFIGDSGYHQFIEQNKDLNKIINSGAIIDDKKNVIGTHKGLPFYTIGQKKGLGLEDNKKTVVEINAKENQIQVGYDHELYVSRFEAKDYYFISKVDIKNPKLTVIVRGIGRNPEGYCKVRLMDKGIIEINLEGKAWALAAGQPIAFYIKDRLVGGAYVKK